MSSKKSAIITKKGEKHQHTLKPLSSFPSKSEEPERKIGIDDFRNAAKKNDEKMSEMKQKDRSSDDSERCVDLLAPRQRRSSSSSSDSHLEEPSTSHDSLDKITVNKSDTQNLTVINHDCDAACTEPTIYFCDMNNHLRKIILDRLKSSWNPHNPYESMDPIIQELNQTQGSDWHFECTDEPSDITNSNAYRGSVLTWGCENSRNYYMLCRKLYGTVNEDVKKWLW